MAQEIVIPRLGWSMEEGIFVGWLKADGDTVRAGEPIFELEGEKGVQEIEAVDEGVLRIPAQSPAPGAVVKVGTVIGFVAAPGEAMPALGNGESSTKSASSAAPVAPPAGPAARRMARQLNVPLPRCVGPGLADACQSKTCSGRWNRRRNWSRGVVAESLPALARSELRRSCTSIGLRSSALAAAGGFASATFARRRRGLSRLTVILADAECRSRIVGG
jgi:hypothetical protein